MITVKLSHSILSAWAMGRQEEAVGMYLGKPLPASEAMELGKTYDEIWNDYILTHKERPLELGGGKLENPQVQVKFRKRIPFSDDYEIVLSGVPDMIDTATGDYDGVKFKAPMIIDEHKCGRTTANQYIDRFQLDYYKLLVPDATLGVYRCYNPYLDSLTIAVKYLSDSNAERALEHVITFGGEMIQYLAANKLIIDFKGDL